MATSSNRISDRRNLEGWLKRFDEDSAVTHYSYPTAEADTLSSEEVQDPGKRQREIAEIKRTLDFDWSCALDFGCGVGDNFSIFDSCCRGDGTLFALDADPGRLCLAATRARKVLQYIRPTLRCGNIGIIAGAGPTLYFDYTLCCQVIGHTKWSETEAIVRSLLGRLRRGGRLVVLYPVRFPAARELPFADSTDARSDLFHEVDLRLGPDKPGFRRPITRAEFDMLAEAPRPGILPVRCFSVSPTRPLSHHTTPFTLDATPTSLAQLLPSRIRSQTRIYSVHVRAPSNGEPAIGDAISTIETS